MDINNTGAGKTVRCKGYTAFLPDPLPPPLNWPLALINALSEADHILGRLSAEGSKLPNPHLLIQPFITREAVLSSRIEGTQATVEEILASDAGGIVARNPNDLGRVLN